MREKGFRVDPSEQKVSVGGKIIQEEKKYYFLLNKPVGVVSTVKDAHAKKKITDFFWDIDARLYPVGRLDKDTTGLIIITNDGTLTNLLAHPRYEIDKEYEVRAKPPVEDKDLKNLEKGLLLEDGKTAPCIIKKIRQTAEEGLYSINLHEGRNRQIRRMFGALGSKVIGLKRVKYAGLTLKGLPEGEYRELTEKEVEKLKE